MVGATGLGPGRRPARTAAQRRRPVARRGRRAPREANWPAPRQGLAQAAPARDPRRSGRRCGDGGGRRNRSPGGRLASV